MPSVPGQRNRLATAAFLAVVVLAGLLSRSHLAKHLPAFIATYAGDTLWALALFLFIGFLRPGIRTTTAALLTVGIAFAVEFSQLYQADWINAIRQSRIGVCLLGNRFVWSDLPCYVVGCLMGMTVEGVRGVIGPAGKGNKVLDGEKQDGLAWEPGCQRTSVSPTLRTAAAAS